MKKVNLYLSEYQCYLLRQVLGDYLINSRERLSNLRNGDCFDVSEINQLIHFNKSLHGILSDMDKLLEDYEYSKNHEFDFIKALSTLGKENNGGK